MPARSPLPGTPVRCRPRTWSREPPSSGAAVRRRDRRRRVGPLTTTLRTRAAARTAPDACAGDGLDAARGLGSRLASRARRPSPRRPSSRRTSPRRSSARTVRPTELPCRRRESAVPSAVAAAARLEALELLLEPLELARQVLPRGLLPGGTERAHEQRRSGEELVQDADASAQVVLDRQVRVLGADVLQVGLVLLRLRGEHREVRVAQDRAVEVGAGSARAGRGRPRGRAPAPRGPPGRRARAARSGRGRRTRSRPRRRGWRRPCGRRSRRSRRGTRRRAARRRARGSPRRARPRGPARRPGASGCGTTGRGIPSVRRGPVRRPGSALSRRSRRPPTTLRTYADNSHCGASWTPMKSSLTPTVGTRHGSPQT